MTHTPTPWIGHASRASNADYSLFKQDGDYLTTDAAEREENAAFIVRACNAYAVLINELEYQRTLAARRFNAALEKNASNAVLNKLQFETDRIERALKLARGEV